MAEACSSKRQREDTLVEEFIEDSTKRHKSSSYNQIISLLEDDEDATNHDLSAVLSTLQKELSSCDCDPLPSSGDHSLEAETELQSKSNASAAAANDCSSSLYVKEDHSEEENVEERMIRHLLEASDDELGIPNNTDGVDYVGSDEINGGDCSFSLCDGLWEFEDEAANYYALLQSELFM